MAVVDVNCVACEGKKVIRHGQTEAGDQRYRCKENGCGKTFKLSYRYKAREHGVKDRIVDMALNGSGVRDTARVLSVAIGTVITTLKKKPATSSKST